jgi:hypothetical protein
MLWHPESKEREVPQTLDLRTMLLPAISGQLKGVSSCMSEGRRQ